MSCTKKHNKSTCIVKVLSYPSFFSLMGPGKSLADSFYEKYKCKVEYFNAGESALILKQLQQRMDDYDIVLGIDQLMLTEALKAISWLEIKSIVKKIQFSKNIQTHIQDFFIPYDWSPLTLIAKAPISPAAQVRTLDWYDWQKQLPNKSISLQDPRTSTPGMQFLWWWSQKDNQWPILSKLHSVSASWSSAYSYFQSGSAGATFSYITSLIYEWQQNDKAAFNVFNHASGHPYQIEFMGIPGSTHNKEMAKKYILHLLSSPSQEIISQKNYMLPVIKTYKRTKLHKRLPSFTLLQKNSLNEFLKNKKEVLKSWTKSLK